MAKIGQIQQPVYNNTLSKPANLINKVDNIIKGYQQNPGQYVEQNNLDARDRLANYIVSNIKYTHDEFQKAKSEMFSRLKTPNRDQGQIQKDILFEGIICRLPEPTENEGQSLSTANIQDKIEISQISNDPAPAAFSPEQFNLSNPAGKICEEPEEMLVEAYKKVNAKKDEIRAQIKVIDNELAERYSYKIAFEEQISDYNNSIKEYDEKYGSLEALKLRQRENEVEINDYENQKAALEQALNSFHDLALIQPSEEGSLVVNPEADVEICSEDDPIAAPAPQMVNNKEEVALPAQKVFYSTSSYTDIKAGLSTSSVKYIMHNSEVEADANKTDELLSSLDKLWEEVGIYTVAVNNYRNAYNEMYVQNQLRMLQVTPKSHQTKSAKKSDSANKNKKNKFNIKLNNVKNNFNNKVNSFKTKLSAKLSKFSNSN